jgi:hypothetical protein
LRGGRPVDVLGVAREQELVVIALGGQHLGQQLERFMRDAKINQIFRFTG